MYIYILYIYTIYIYVYIYMYVYMYVYMYIYIHTHMYTHTYTHIYYTHTYIYMYSTHFQSWLWDPSMQPLLWPPRYFECEAWGLAIARRVRGLKLSIENWGRRGRPKIHKKTKVCASGLWLVVFAGDWAIVRGHDEIQRMNRMNTSWIFRSPGLPKLEDLLVVTNVFFA